MIASNLLYDSSFSFGMYLICFSMLLRHLIEIQARKSQLSIGVMASYKKQFDKHFCLFQCGNTWTVTTSRLIVPVSKSHCGLVGRWHYEVATSMDANFFKYILTLSQLRQILKLHKYRLNGWKLRSFPLRFNWSTVQLLKDSRPLYYCSNNTWCMGLFAIMKTVNRYSMVVLIFALGWPLKSINSPSQYFQFEMIRDETQNIAIVHQSSKNSKVLFHGILA